MNDTFYLDHVIDVQGLDLDQDHARVQNHQGKKDLAREAGMVKYIIFKMLLTMFIKFF